MAAIEVAPLGKKHLEDLGVTGPFLTDYSFAAVRDGRTIAIAGISEQWEGRGVAWFYGTPSKREWVEITRLVRKGLLKALKRFRRIEVAVVESHVQGRRWAKKLGFRFEARCEGYTPDGKPAWLYAIVRDDGPEN